MQLRASEQNLIQKKVMRTSSNRPVLLTDCDNVLLNWFANLPLYMNDVNINTSHLTDMLKGNPFIHPRVLFNTTCDNEAMKHLIQYNESHYMSTLPVMEKNAVDSLQRISEHFDIIVVTNISDKELSRLFRAANLRDVYGDIFSDVVCLPPFSDKSDAIREIASSHDVSLFVDDNLAHVKESINAGVKGYQYTYNMICGRNTGEVPEVKMWSDIERLLI